MTGIDIAVSILTLMPKAIDVLDRLLNGITQEKLNRFLSLLEASLDDINDAKSEEEKRAAAIKLSKAIRNLR